MTPRDTVALQHLAQVLQRIQLDLPHSFPRHANFVTNLLQRRATIAVQAEAPLHNLALLVTQLANPVVDDVVDVICLRAA